jgi:acetyl-CoA carboxylase biotin carboxyl carrier protein
MRLYTKNLALGDALELKDIKLLVDLMKKNDLSVFKMEQEGFKITLKRGSDYQPVITTSTVAPTAQYSAPVAALPAPTAPAPTAASTTEEKFKEISSPMVGTFYSAGSPDAKPYVEAGATVTPDTVVCIIEAMKVMNEIKAEISGVITEVCAQNGKAVQFGQPLFKVK